MKASHKKAWLRELAKWSRTLANAPGGLLVLQWMINGVSAFLGGGVVVSNVEEVAKANLPALALSAAVYIAANALARWLELQADEIDDSSQIILLDRPRVREVPDGDSS